MGVSVADYFAARKRLRRIETGEDNSDVYPTLDATIGGDKLIVYDAENSNESATVGWCKEAGFECEFDGVYTTCKYGCVELMFLQQFSELYISNTLKCFDDPTCGEVLTLLRFSSRMRWRM